MNKQKKLDGPELREEDGENLKPSRDVTKLQDAYNRGSKQGKFEERERIIKLLEDAFEDTAYYNHRLARIEDILEALQEEK